MSSEALIRDLSTGLVPVRRRSPWREALIVAAIVLAELALIFALGVERPDLGTAIRLPFMWWKLASLGLIAAAGTAVALRSFAPETAPGRGVPAVAALAILAALGGVLTKVGPAMGDTLAERLYPAHGLACALAIVALALPVVGALSVLMRRAAPTRPATSAAAIGLAAAGWGALVFALCCPMSDPLYVAVWYAAACTAIAVVARRLLPRGYRL